ncbi:MAG: RNA polymerase sigma factor [Acidimicrobiales bacterium]|nr:RNA polymerase sigma factor [Acidimicrobiales bacterium]
MTIGDDFPAVLAAAQAGDRRSIERIYRDVAPLVTGYVRANGARDPDDVASEVFISMVTALGQFSGEERQFRSWLLTIAHRRLVDSMRRQGRRREDPVPDEQLGRAAALGDGEAEALARLRSRGIVDAMADLTDDQRAVLTLRVLADLPVKEVAAILGRPESAVKALLRRAVAAMERRLGPLDASEGQFF